MNYNFANAITITKDTITKQFWDVNGRTSRSDFWHYQSIVFIASFVVGFVGGMVGLPIIGSILGLALLAPNIGIAIRRMHDQDKVWWFMLIPF